MKSTIFKSFFFTSLLVLAAACGKDGGGGGGTSYSSNPYTGSQGNENLAANAIQSYNAIVTWKNDVQANRRPEGSLMANGRGYSRGVVSISNSNTPSIPAGCENVGWKYFPIIWCSGGSTPTPPTVTPLSVIEKRCTSVTYPNNNGVPVLRYMNAQSISSSGCVPTGAETTYSIGNNTELNQLLAFQKGKILQIVGTGGVYTISVGNKVPEGYATPVTAIYEVDTRRHSIYSPTSTQTSNTEITTIYEAY